jgi:hypothetical protein
VTALRIVGTVLLAMIAALGLIATFLLILSGDDHTALLVFLVSVASLAFAGFLDLFDRPRR